RRHTRFSRDWSSDVCSSDLVPAIAGPGGAGLGKAGESPRTVEFGRSGKRAVLEPGSSMLELAESVGARITAVCRSGACGNCQTRILSGTVGYGAPPAFAPDPGSCLPCVCRPTSDLVLDA